MKSILPVKTIASVRDVSGGTQLIAQLGIPLIMAVQASSSSSEEILSDGNDSNDCNLYDSDVGEMSETSQDVGPRPYRFESRRVWRN